MGRWRSGAAICAALLLGTLSPAVAQDVTLSSLGGGLSVSGTLRAYDGEVYRLDSAYGLLTLDAAGVVCEGPGCPDLAAFAPEVRIVGPAYPAEDIAAALVADFALANGYDIARAATSDGFAVTLSRAGRSVARFVLRRMGEAQALAALAGAEADLALVASDPGQAEGRMIALDPLLPVVAQGNPVARIGLRDLRAVQAGAMTNWAEVGGPDMPLVLHVLAPDAAPQRQIDARLGGAVQGDAVIHPDLASLAAGVAGDPWALALVPASRRGAAVAALLTDTCGHFLRPGRFAVKAEDYPLAVAVHLLAPRRRLPGVARAFLDHSGTPSAQSAIAAAGFADLAPEVQAVTDQGARLVNAIRAAGPEVPLAELQRLAEGMGAADRLSLTFRFEGGARQFDAASRTHIADLARMLEAGLLDGREVVFVGFSDGDGDARANLALSRARAEATRAAVMAAAPLLAPDRVRLSVEAFGEALPIACDDTPIGRGVNRRVEVWLRSGGMTPTDTLARGN